MYVVSWVFPDETGANIRTQIAIVWMAIVIDFYLLVGKD